MTETTEFDFKPMAKLVCENYPPAKDWTSESLGDWLIWAGEHGFLLETFNTDTNETTGVAIVRPVNKIPANDDFYEYDINGDIINIDMCVAPSWEARRGLAFGLLELMGERRFITLRHNGKAKLHKFEKVMMAVLKQEL